METSHAACLFFRVPEDYVRACFKFVHFPEYYLKAPPEFGII